MARRPTILLVSLAAALVLPAAAEAQAPNGCESRDPLLREPPVVAPAPVVTPAPVATPDPGATVIAQAPPPPRRFVGYMSWIGCDREIELGRRGRLVFTDNVAARTRYRVCLIRPSGTRSCEQRTARRAGRQSRITFRARERGRYRAEWYVDGRRRARWTFRAFPRRRSAPLPPTIGIEGKPPPNDGRAPGQVPDDTAVISGARFAPDGLPWRLLRDDE